LFLGYTVFSLISFAGEKDNGKYYYQNAVYKEEIKTVQLFVDGNELSNPIIELNSTAPLVLKFDDLSGVVKDYYYTIIHCDADWNESTIMQNEYIDGFTDNQLKDYAFSINTTVKYVNFRLELPNEDVNLKYSGNYVVVVFEDNDKEKLVLVRRFQLLEPLARIEGKVKRATFDAFKGSNQEVDFEIYTGNLNAQSPAQDIKVVVCQNRRWDNAILGLKPLFIRDQSLSYDYNKENVFPGGNEFRYFDIRSHRYNGENVAATEFHRPYYHTTLATDQMRSNKKFFSYREMNGKFTVETQERVQD